MSAPRWYVVERGEIKYSCAERNRQKAENFDLDNCLDAIIVLAASSEDALKRAKGISKILPVIPHPYSGA